MFLAYVHKVLYLFYYLPILILVILVIVILVLVILLLIILLLIILLLVILVLVKLVLITQGYLDPWAYGVSEWRLQLG